MGAPWRVKSMGAPWPAELHVVPCHGYHTHVARAEVMVPGQALQRGGIARGRGRDMGGFIEFCRGCARCMKGAERGS